MTTFCKIVLLFLLLFPSLGQAAPELRLVGRVLDVSTSKKTILVNRGKEDGLRIDDHAKFSLPEGILARAILVRLSPGRSVWSIYKFYQKDKIVENIIITLKTTSPLKLTPDPTKNLDILAPESVSSKEKSTSKLKIYPKKKKVIHQFDKVDYSNLDDLGKPQKLNPAIDWNNLHNLQQVKKHAPQVDFSNLY